MAGFWYPKHFRSLSFIAQSWLWLSFESSCYKESSDGWKELFSPYFCLEWRPLSWSWLHASIMVTVHLWPTLTFYYHLNYHKMVVVVSSSAYYVSSSACKNPNLFSDSPCYDVYSCRQLFYTRSKTSSRFAWLSAICDKLLVTVLQVFFRRELNTIFCLISIIWALCLDLKWETLFSIQ